MLSKGIRLLAALCLTAAFSAAGEHADCVKKCVQDGTAKKGQCIAQHTATMQGCSGMPDKTDAEKKKKKACRDDANAAKKKCDADVEAWVAKCKNDCPKDKKTSATLQNADQRPKNLKQPR